MKKFISVISAAVLLLTGVVFASAAEKGDVDADGRISASDARMALRFSVGLEIPTDEQKVLADFDSNGTITAADARCILRVSVGLPVDGNENPENPENPAEPEVPVQKPVHVPSERELAFYNSLYETAHPMLGGNIKAFEFPLLKNFQKWCCLYTIKYVFRPALEKAGYSKSEIDRLAPQTFSSDSLSKILSNATNISWSDKFVVDSLPLYVPSLLADYYIKTPEAADVYFLYDFYDDMVETKVYEHSDEDIKNYTPRIGDVLFISNKSDTYANGYPTVDHTAQIIKVYKDGTFLCTEGSLLDKSEGDGIARVRERRYMFDKQTGAYCYVDFDANLIYRSIVVLYAAQPKF